MSTFEESLRLSAADRSPRLVGEVTLDELAKPIRNSERFHLPFNPDIGYYLGTYDKFYVRSNRPPCRFAGHYELSFWAKMWAADEPHEWDEVVCEGYRFNISVLKQCRFLWHLSYEQRRAADGDPRLAGFAKRLSELVTELEQLLTPLYTEAIFWFKPGPVPGVSPEYQPIFRTYGQKPRDPCDPNDPVWRLFRAEAPAEGEERRVPYWWDYGRWITTPMPEPVVWLQRQARQLKDERVSVLTRITLMEWLRQKSVAKRRTVHHKEYLGELPVKRVRPVPNHLVGDYYPRGRIPRPQPIEDQWYDPVEELDQTHADRRLELANALVQLPPFTAYIRTPTTQHHVALTPPADANIDEPRIEQVRQASKARFGRPPESPKPSARPAAPEGPGDRPAGSRIARHPSEE